MENCLVTKLKGEVQSDNLPMFDKAFIDYFGGWTTGNLRFYIVSGTKPVTVKSKKQFYVGTTHTTPVFEYEIQPNTSCLMEYEASDIGTDPVDKIIEINGIYNLVKIGNSFTYDLFGYNIPKYFDFTPTNVNGLSSLLNYSPLDCFEGYIDYSEGHLENFDEINTNLQCAQIFTNSGVDAVNVDNILNSNRLQMFGIMTKTSVPLPGLLLSTGALSNCSTLKVLIGRYQGDISDLPVNLKVHKGSGSLTTGTVESYVAKCVAAGRTSGNIVFQVGFANVTLNGLALTYDNFSDKVFEDSDAYWVNVTWTNGVINPLSNTKPGDFGTYIPVRAIYTWEPYPDN